MQTYSFGDIRLDRRGAAVTQQIVATGSLVLRRFGGGRDGEVAAGRFLASPKVTVEAIIDTHSTRTQAAAQGRRIVAVQDTTQVNFSGRDRSRKGLGPGGWNCYYKPPDPKTMAIGWRQLAAMVSGYVIATPGLCLTAKDV